MKMAVFGSRTIQDPRAMEIIHRYVTVNSVSVIVTAQEPKGVCKIAQTYAKRFSLPLELHFLDKIKRAQGAWHHRSLAVIKSADLILLIHDGISQGTANELAETQKSKKTFFYEVLSPTDQYHRMATDVDIPNKAGVKNFWASDSAPPVDENEPDWLKAALAYADDGKPVVPCDPKTRIPFTPNGFKDATTDPDQIEAWWNRWPGAIVGLAYHAPPQLFTETLRPPEGP